jgi:murein DD-endopeptidase MepM/ murein hydrolase activator NlpD
MTAFNNEIELIKKFLGEQGVFWGKISTSLLGWVGVIKSSSAKMMYRQRGRFSQSFINVSMAGLAFLAIVFSGTVEELINSSGNKEVGGSNYLIMATDQTGGADTQISNLPKGETTEYRVENGDTISAIAVKFGVSIDTIMWENNLKSVDQIKPKQILRILPVTGVRYKVARGETIYSIAKKLQVDAQNIIDYPFNTFSNDETFALYAGQELIIPDGIKPKEIVIDTAKYLARTVAPIPGVKGEGNFMWPTSGHITQKFYWYHQATDIASRDSPNILASQGGTVVTAGWNAGGYGNYVIIDHGNGYKTLYGHMLNNSIVVQPGQRVTQGQKIGIMGSTGRSTGPHLHFEVKGPNGNLDPLVVLK